MEEDPLNSSIKIEYANVFCVKASWLAERLIIEPYPKARTFIEMERKAYFAFYRLGGQ